MALGAAAGSPQAAERLVEIRRKLPGLSRAALLEELAALVADESRWVQRLEGRGGPAGEEHLAGPGRD